MQNIVEEWSGHSTRPYLTSLCIPMIDERSSEQKLEIWRERLFLSLHILFDYCSQWNLYFPSFAFVFLFISVTANKWRNKFCLSQPFFAFHLLAHTSLGIFHCFKSTLQKTLFVIKKILVFGRHDWPEQMILTGCIIQCGRQNKARSQTRRTPKLLTKTQTKLPLLTEVVSSGYS